MLWHRALFMKCQEMCVSCCETMTVITMPAPVSTQPLHCSCKLKWKKKKTHTLTHTHSFPPPSFSLSLSRTSWHCFIILACTSCLHWVKLTVPWLPLLSPHTNVNTDHHEAGEEGKNRRVGGKEGSRGRLERDTNRKICKQQLYLFADLFVWWNSCHILKTNFTFQDKRARSHSQGVKYCRFDMSHGVSSRCRRCPLASPL